MSELGIDGFASYLGFLRSSPPERAGLADLMRVTMTRLFREREEWQRLAERVLPLLVSENQTGSVQGSGEALRPGGVLMTARKEHLPEAISPLFEPWQETPHFYRRNG